MTARRVAVKTPLCSLTGYGRDGIGLAQAFEHAGWEVHLMPTATYAPLPHDVAMMLTREPTPPFDLLINHIDPPNITITPGDRRSSAVTVAWTMWEWKEYTGPNAEVITDQLKNFDALVSYDPVSFSAFDSLVPEGTKHIVQQGGFDPEPWPLNKNREWAGTFRYCMVAQMNPRKNPFLAVEAFDELKKEHGDGFDAELHLKTLTPFFHPSMEDAYPGVKIHYAYYTLKQMLEFYSDKHVLISTSHGEGKNVPAMEAMSTGMVTIATAFGGHTQWQHPAWCLPLNYTEGQILGGTAAIPSKEHLKELMWRAYTNRQEMMEMGARASVAIKQQSSWDNTISRMLDKLRVEGIAI